MTPVALVALALAGCGRVETAASENDLASWRDRVCALNAAYTDAARPEVPATNDAQELWSPEQDRRAVTLMLEFAAELRAIPLPEEQREAAHAYVEYHATVAERYEESISRVRQASRRWERVTATIEPDELPPAPEGETVVGAIMTQLLSVPAARDAWNDLQRELAAFIRAVDGDEGKRLARSLGLDRCELGTRSRDPETGAPRDMPIAPSP
jgi:hypothetical protein